MFEESFKNFLDTDPAADDFQNLISSSLCTDTSVVSICEDPPSSFYVKLLTDRKTNRQTNEGHYVTSLVEIMEDHCCTEDYQSFINGSVQIACPFRSLYIMLNANGPRRDSITLTHRSRTCCHLQPTEPKL